MDEINNLYKIIIEMIQHPIKSWPSSALNETDLVIILVSAAKHILSIVNCLPSLCLEACNPTIGFNLGYIVCNHIRLIVRG